MRDHIGAVRILLLCVLGATGCYVETVEEGPPPSYGGRPPPSAPPAPSAGRIVDRIDAGGTCTSGECRVECGPEGACPTGSLCAWVQCIRAPCPSYCQAMAEGTPDVPAPVGPGAEGATCGTRGASQCAANLYCMHAPSASCGEADAPGTCQARPEICTRDYRPVCGCDGRTYGNACSAAAQGVSVRHDGSCAGSPPQAGACVRGGCSGELCVEPGREMASICIARPEHACYASATCARQPDGQCGWSMTRELSACLQSPPPIR